MTIDLVHSLTSHHLLPLQVVLPLLSAPVAFFFSQLRPDGNGMTGARLTWAWAQVIALSCLAISLALCGHLAATGAPLSYAMGNWAPPVGIEYRLDWLNAPVLVLVSAMASLTLFYGRRSVEDEVPGAKQGMYYVSFLLCLAGLLGMALTADAFNVFVFLEITALSSYALISLGRRRNALVATFNYLVIGTIGATFYVIGIGMLYMLTGTLNMADLAQRLSVLPGSRTEVVAISFLLTGLAIKLALFPLHKWLPAAYTEAPSAVSVFLASTATKVALYVLIRMFFSVLDGVPLLADHKWAEVLLPLAVTGMFSASVVAIFQNNVKTMLAWSSVAQIGYMALGAGLASEAGLTASLTHMLNHAAMKGCLFMATGCVILRIGSCRIEDWSGLGKTMPLTMFALLAGGLSLMGIPLTAGFVSKWLLMVAAFDRDWWPLAVLIVLSSLLAVVYVWRLMETVWLRPPSALALTAREAPWSMLLPLYLLVAANLWLGVDTRLTAGIAGTAARALLQPATGGL